MQFADMCAAASAALDRDLMAAAHILHAILKVVGREAGLDDAIRESGYRFAGPRKSVAIT